MNRYVCVHAHFYQPPREDPWLDAVTAQPSAAPYHDWNERIVDECYAPNAASRRLDGEGLIVDIVNNYGCISFDMGPTLLDWLERNEPELHEAIIGADATSRERFGGHGSALAQAHSHTILPLASDRDLHTQVEWGVRDFQSRFNRDPEGMWLPETAVDVRTLEAIATAGIRFTVLEPHQASRLAGDDPERAIDPRIGYRVQLPSGRELGLFFYDGAISRAVAFEDLLQSGDRLAGRIMAAFDDRPGPQLLSLATDGETFGHHQKFGEMALTHATWRFQRSNRVRLTNFGQFLELHPPEEAVQVRERTSWSCAHGVERWRGDCGCHTGGQAGWDQAWRAPLRAALDWLGGELAAWYEQAAAELIADPWKARDEYIEVLRDRSAEARAAFLARHAPGATTPGAQIRVWQMLECQRNAMFMFTSCGWFFSDLAGIETVQVLRYAARAVELATVLGAPALEPGLTERLASARSNRVAMGTGADIYLARAASRRVELSDVAATAAALLLWGDVDRLPGHALRVEQVRRHLGAVTAELRVQRQITGEQGTFAVRARQDGHSISAAVRPVDSPGSERRYGLADLLPDQKQEILRRLTEPLLEEVGAAHRRAFERLADLQVHAGEHDSRFGQAIEVAVEYVVRADLLAALAPGATDLVALREALGAATRWGVVADDPTVAVRASHAVTQRAAEVVADAGSIGALEGLRDLLRLVTEMPGPVSLWRAQNLIFRHACTIDSGADSSVGADEKRRRELMAEVAGMLSIRWPPAPPVVAAP